MSSKNVSKTRTSKRTLKLNMPQMAFKGLSEYWLFKELGDMHWSMISEAFKTGSHSIVDSSGERLYASFLRIRLESSAALSSFKENDEIILKGELKRFGEKMFFSDTVLNSNSKTIKSSLMSMFVARKIDNKGLSKATPLNSWEAEVETSDSPPPFASEYLSLKKELFDPKSSNLPEISLNGEPFEPGRKNIFSADYQIEPYNDLNGVNLLYFASYPKINDIRERKYFHFLRDQLGFEEDWSLQTSLLARDVWYFGNCDIDDCRFIEGYRVKISSSLIRKKDDFLMAKIFTIKQLAVDKNLPQSAFSQLWEMKVSQLPVFAPKANKKDVVKILIGLSANILGLKKDALNEKSDLKALKLESVVLTELAEQLASKHQLFINPSRFYEFSDFVELADYFVKGEKKGPYIKIEPEFENNEKSAKEIAVIGMSGRFPQAENPGLFWENLIQGKDCVGEIPAERWDWRKYYGDPSKEKNKTNSKWGGFLEKAEEFDAAFFNISPREAELTDPQQRLLLEEVWHALEDAGYRASELAGSDSGVFVGVCHNDYHDLLKESGRENEFYQATGSSFSIVANRVSYFFDFHGPSLAIDTACSSSLVAIHQAVESLMKGECSRALAGGVNLCLSPRLFLAYGQAGMLSPDGRCKTFDQRADGYVRGEGVGVILLKPLAKALADNDRIYGVIKGSAVNHGGQVNSLTVPNPNAQAELIVKAHQEAGFAPRSVGYIECHGTGTSLGDPVEINGLKKAFADIYRARGPQTPTEAYCALGSVKTNIGHLEGAAGIAGLIKILLAFQRKKLPKALHFEKLNPYIELESSPFYIVDELQDWRPLKDESGDDFPLRAGVSSFGFGGANAHVVLEEYRAESAPPPEFTSPYLIILSAKNEDRLKSYAKKLILFLEKSGDKISIADLAYTLQIGREAMEERMALTVDDTKELLDKLKEYLKAAKQTSGLYLGNVKKNNSETELLVEGKAGRDFIKTLIAEQEIKKLARLWVGGVEIDWNLLYGKIQPKKISLPTYPFAGERHWIPIAENKPLVQPGAALHPLLDSNISDLKEQSFAKELRKDQFYLKDHRVKGEMILPGAAHLEMVRAAGSLANKEEQPSALKNIIWYRPLKAGNEPEKVKVILYPENEKLLWQIADANSGETIYSRGELEYGQASPILDPIMDIDSLRERCSESKSKAECYRMFEKAGLEYGPAFQVIDSLHYNKNEALAHLKAPDFLKPEFDRFTLHPSLLDGALQTVAGLSASEDETFLPFALKELRIIAPLETEIRAYATLNSKSDSKVKSFDIKLLNLKGELLASLSEFSVRAFQDGALKEKSESLFFTPVWEVFPLEEEEKELSGSVLIFNDDESFLKSFKKKFPRSEPVPLKPEDARPALIKSLADEDRAPDKIIWLSGQDEGTDIKERLANSFRALFDLAKALISSKVKRKLKLLYLYQNSSNTVYFDRAVSGLAKTVTLEQPRFFFQTLGVDDLSDAESVLEKISSEFNNVERAAEVRHRNGLREVMTFREFKPEELNRDEIPLQNKGIYLITGGLGGLGLIFSRYLAENYQPKLVLIGRSKPDEVKKEKLSELANLGAEALYIQADISDLKEVEKLTKEAKKRFGEINGVIHSAGVIKDSLILNKTEEEIAAVLAPKVGGALNLDEALKDEKLDFMVFFSSIAGVLGNVGQADYAFANAFLDNFAQNRRKLVAQGQRFGKTISINWPYWAEGGMRVDHASQKWLKNKFGFDSLKTKEGLKAFEISLRADFSQTMVLSGDKAKIRKLFAPPASDAAAKSAPSIPAAKAEKQAKADLLRLLAQGLKVSEDDLDEETNLKEYGLESILMMDLLNQLEELYDCSLDANIFIEYSTIGKLAVYLADQGLVKAESPQAPPEKKSQVKSFGLPPLNKRKRNRFIGVPSMTESFSKIAVVSLGCRFPGAEDGEAFWQNLKRGASSVIEVPAERWKADDYYSPELTAADQTYSKWGGYIENIDLFDASYFGVSDDDALMMDPQHRIILELSGELFERAGYQKEELSGSKTGVYLGGAASSYMENRPDNISSAQMKSFIVGAISNMMAARISNFYNFSGPSLVTDTACSSSLAAVHQACRDIQSGVCDQAVAGGIGLLLDPDPHIGFSQSGALSKEDRSYVFDERAGGFVLGEGAGLVLLKNYDRALKDGDQISGTILASAINNDGHTMGLTAPNQEGQKAVIKEAIEKSGIDPSTITCLEAHGTGTLLGDPIEIKAASQVYRRHTDKKQYCAVGSVKSNIGHLLRAAGAASLIKVLLAL